MPLPRRGLVETCDLRMSSLSNCTFILLNRSFSVGWDSVRLCTHIKGGVMGVSFFVDLNLLEKRTLSLK